MADILSKKRSHIVLLRLRNFKIIPKQPLKIAKSVHGRRVWIYRRISCILEFTYAQVQRDAAHWRLAERLKEPKKQLLTQRNEEAKIITGKKTKHRIVESWKTVLLSVESYFFVQGKHSRFVSGSERVSS